jgi:hypothetical protein
MAKWHCHIDGKQYGPVDNEQLADWIREGRVQRSDLVWQEGMGDWLPASSVPALAPLFPEDPFGAAGGGSVPPTVRARTKRRTLEPHRGGTVLTLGILGLLCCGICGIIAWVMGSGDLKKIDAKQMDPAGRGNTQAGMICGIIATILWVLGTIVHIGFMGTFLR